jgi:hypothetical protein
MDRSLRTPEGETLLRRDRDQLADPLIQGYVISDERKEPDTHCQGPG